ncbi:MAG TPA: hypothetical protein EYH22_00595, partial [Candidatus Nanopusillus sp.]|nr:hypothetical protein [Candidatus Nanopusillus sp.]
ILVISENYEKAKFIFERIIERLNELINKIPKDTRQASKDGTTSFLRPQPGSARMYPETDHPLIYIERKERDKDWYKEIVYKVSYGNKEFHIKLARLIDKSIHKYEELKNTKDLFILDKLDPRFRKLVLKSRGFNDKQVEDILWSEYIDLIEDYSKEVKPSILYYIVFMLPAEFKKEYKEAVSIDKKFVEEVCQLLKEDKITRDALKPILYYYVREQIGVKEIVEKYNLYKISNSDLKKKVEELLEKYKELNEKKRINKILNELRVIADPKNILSIINNIKNKGV